MLALTAVPVCLASSLDDDNLDPQEHTEEITAATDPIAKEKARREEVRRAQAVIQDGIAKCDFYHAQAMEIIHSPEYEQQRAQKLRDKNIAPGSRIASLMEQCDYKNEIGRLISADEEKLQQASDKPFMTLRRAREIVNEDKALVAAARRGMAPQSTPHPIVQERSQAYLEACSQESQKITEPSAGDFDPQEQTEEITVATDRIAEENAHKEEVRRARALIKASSDKYGVYRAQAMAIIHSPEYEQQRAQKLADNDIAYRSRKVSLMEHRDLMKEIGRLSTVDEENLQPSDQPFMTLTRAREIVKEDEAIAEADRLRKARRALTPEEQEDKQRREDRLAACNKEWQKITGPARIADPKARAEALGELAPAERGMATLLINAKEERQKQQQAKPAKKDGNCVMS